VFLVEIEKKNSENLKFCVSVDDLKHFVSSDAGKPSMALSLFVKAHTKPQLQIYLDIEIPFARGTFA